MGTRDRRLRAKQLLRQEILDAARTLFIREGYENVSMRKIAERIDYSPTTIYLHFKDKSDLLFAVCDETFAKLVQEFQALEKNVKDPVQGLRKGLHAYVEFGLRYPQHYLLTFVIPHQHGHDPSRYVSPEAMGMKAFAFLPRLVAECIKRKKFRPVDVHAASQAMWTAVHGVTAALIVHPEFPWAKRDLVIDHVINGMIKELQA